MGIILEILLEVFLRLCTVQKCTSKRLQCDHYNTLKTLISGYVPFPCFFFFSSWRQNCLNTTLLWSPSLDFIYARVQCLIEGFVFKLNCTHSQCHGVLYSMSEREKNTFLSSTLKRKQFSVKKTHFQLRIFTCHVQFSKWTGILEFCTH